MAPLHCVWRLPEFVTCFCALVPVRSTPRRPVVSLPRSFSARSPTSFQTPRRAARPALHAPAAATPGACAFRVCVGQPVASPGATSRDRHGPIAADAGLPGLTCQPLPNPHRSSTLFRDSGASLLTSLSASLVRGHPNLALPSLSPSLCSSPTAIVARRRSSPDAARPPAGLFPRKLDGSLTDEGLTTGEPAPWAAEIDQVRMRCALQCARRGHEAISSAG